MKLIANHDQHELGFTSSDDRSIDFTRYAARAVLVNEMGQVAMMYFAVTGSYKLPGGGIDEGEVTETALRREVREETGYDITDIQELGSVEEDRYYCGMHQTSYCFLAQAGAFVGTERTKGEIAEGMDTRWFESIEEAIGAVESNTMANDNGDTIGHEMMILREIAILRSAQSILLK